MGQDFACLWRLSYAHSVTHFLGPVSRQSPQNWDLAKQIGLWGITRARLSTARMVSQGDRLIIWLGGKGYVAECVLTGPSRSPRNLIEAPWEGGTYHWAAVVPFKIDFELSKPVWL